MFEFHLVVSRRRHEFKALFNFSKNMASILIYSDFEIVVWWHPNWSPKFFCCLFTAEYTWNVHTKEHSRSLHKNAIPVHQESTLTVTIYRVFFFGSKYRNCQVEWKSIKKIRLFLLSLPTRRLIYFGWKTI